ncbi:minor capsid protein [Streptomyces sp. NPDC053499]|uniref:minor capsid protein n=1 Tax=Streptomyces sp. NPDC053499 TaxID=3365707 RepID=UPI0037D6F3DB
MSVVHGLALLLESLGLLSYDETGTSGDTFVGTMPPTPPEAVSLTAYDAGPQNAAIAYDAVSVQVRVRGTTDPRVSYDRAYDVYDAVNGLSDTTLPDGTPVIICTATTPAPLGPDSNGRHEHVVRVSVEYDAPTTHRA